MDTGRYGDCLTHTRNRYSPSISTFLQLGIGPISRSAHVAVLPAAPFWLAMAMICVFVLTITSLLKRKKGECDINQHSPWETICDCITAYLICVQPLRSLLAANPHEYRVSAFLSLPAVAPLRLSQIDRMHRRPRYNSLNEISLFGGLLYYMDCGFALRHNTERQNGSLLIFENIF